MRYFFGEPITKDNRNLFNVTDGSQGGNNMRRIFVCIFSFCVLLSCCAFELFALELEVVPSLGYTNYFVKRINRGIGDTDERVHKSINFSSASIGLDILIVDESKFTSFFNNHISILENTKETGDVDIVMRRAGSVVEKVLYDASWTLGYTFVIGDFRVGLGAGIGMFAGDAALQENSPFAAGFVLNANADYFFLKSLAFSFGLEDGIYGSIKAKRKDEVLKAYNRFCMRIGIAIKF